MNWYIEALKKYAVFSGRSRRKEFWYFMLFVLVISFVLALIDNGVGNNYDPEAGIGTLSRLYLLAMWIPSLAVSVRRLHDIGRSGWWLLLIFIPVIGGLIFLIFAVQDSKPGTEFGPNPKLSPEAA